jgi:GT2 family glycosyltransferase
MQLSVIIVNYNVKYFLEQCLYSLKAATTNIKTAVWVIDNNSTDGSKEYLTPLFPWVNFIWNKQNVGFGRANNIGIKNAEGDFVLLLNPDTLLQEDSITALIKILIQDGCIGAAGICMLDGKGSILPESKRGFPTPWASFYKLSGIINFFPRSKKFAHYYLGHLAYNKNQEVDVLSGACMLIKKQVLDVTGGFDEDFFMYAEDVDLSYRIQQAGFKNYYVAGSRIIHFKGESTTRNIQYTKAFYMAMLIFVKKHYKHSAFIWQLLLKAAIAVRGLLASLKYFYGANTQLNRHKPSYLLWGSKKATASAAAIIRQQKNTGYISVHNYRLQPAGAQLHNINEVIFCIDDELNWQSAIDAMLLLPKHLSFKWHAAGSNSVAGSNSKNSSGIILHKKQ